MVGMMIRGALRTILPRFNGVCRRAMAMSAEQKTDLEDRVKAEKVVVRIFISHSTTPVYLLSNFLLRITLNVKVVLAHP